MARLEYAMMTVTPVVILFLAQGSITTVPKVQILARGQLRAKLVPRLPVLLSPCNFAKKSQILGVADSSPCFDASVLRSIPSSAEFIGWECGGPPRGKGLIQRFGSKFCRTGRWGFTSCRRLDFKGPMSGAVAIGTLRWAPVCR